MWNCGFWTPAYRIENLALWFCASPWFYKQHSWRILGQPREEKIVTQLVPFSFFPFSNVIEMGARRYTRASKWSPVEGPSRKYNVLTLARPSAPVVKSLLTDRQSASFEIVVSSFRFAGRPAVAESSAKHCRLARITRLLTEFNGLVWQTKKGASPLYRFSARYWWKEAVRPL